MPRTFRTRNRLNASYTGIRRTYVDGVLSVTASNTEIRKGYCLDLVGRPVVDGNLTMTNEYGCILLNGEYTSDYQAGGARVETFEQYPRVAPMNSGDAIPMPPPSGWALDVIARTNPSRPVVTPFTLLQDLIELPKMLSQGLQLLGKPWKAATPKGAASTYLGTVFGWMPLVEDIKKLLDLQSYIDKRCLELNRLYSNRGLKRRIEMGSTNIVKSTSIAQAGSGSAIWTLPVSVSYQKQAWATIRWKPTGSVPYHPGDAAVNKLARQVVSGMSSEGTLKGLWDVLPWSWMINWFTNVGNYALAYSNTVPATHSKPCFMSRCLVSFVPGVPYTTGIKSSSLSFYCDQSYDYKKRTVSSSTLPGCYVPFLDTFRLSVLGSLAIQRMR